MINQSGNRELFACQSRTAQDFYPVVDTVGFRHRYELVADDRAFAVSSILVPVQYEAVWSRSVMLASAVDLDVPPAAVGKERW